jgi:hypothetical protein
MVMFLDVTTHKQLMLTRIGCYETLAKFKCTQMIATNGALIHEQNRSKLNLMNACCHSVNKISYQAPESIRIKIYETSAIHVVVNTCESWSPVSHEDERRRGGR